jgi:hypothetical protein
VDIVTELNHNQVYKERLTRCFLPYCLLLGIILLVMSQYGDPPYGPHSMDAPTYIAQAGIGFIWLGVRMAGAWGLGWWILTSNATPYVTPRYN